jgi:hypothetical protein
MRPITSAFSPLGPIRQGLLDPVARFAGAVEILLAAVAAKRDSSAIAQQPAVGIIRQNRGNRLAAAVPRHQIPVGFPEFPGAFPNGSVVSEARG